MFSAVKGKGKKAESLIETPRGKAVEESDSVKDFFSVLFAYPVAEPSGIALTGIQPGPGQRPGLIGQL